MLLQIFIGVVFSVTAHGLQNRGPVLNLRILKGVPFLVYAFPKVYELLFIVVFLLQWLNII